MDQSRHSGRRGAQARNPYPIGTKWIPAFAGMTI